MNTRKRYGSRNTDQGVYLGPSQTQILPPVAATVAATPVAPPPPPPLQDTMSCQDRTQEFLSACKSLQSRHVSTGGFFWRVCVCESAWGAAALVHPDFEADAKLELLWPSRFGIWHEMLESRQWQRGWCLPCAGISVSDLQSAWFEPCGLWESLERERRCSFPLCSPWKPLGYSVNLSQHPFSGPKRWVTCLGPLLLGVYADSCILAGQWIRPLHYIGTSSWGTRGKQQLAFCRVWDDTHLKCIFLYPGDGILSAWFSFFHFWTLLACCDRCAVNVSLHLFRMGFSWTNQCWMPCGTEVNSLSWPGKQTNLFAPQRDGIEVSESPEQSQKPGPTTWQHLVPATGEAAAVWGTGVWQTGWKHGGGVV